MGVFLVRILIYLHAHVFVSRNPRAVLQVSCKVMSFEIFTSHADTLRTNRHSGPCSLQLSMCSPLNDDMVMEVLRH
jgi:hypothetical protein